MNRIVRIIIIVLICLMFVQVFPVTGQEKQEGRRWTGKYKDETVITEEVLIRIVKEHERWIETDEKNGKQANLSGADLSGANLSGTNLFEADLRGSSLRGADLSGAVLIETDMSGVDLRTADLSGANLSGANLNRTNLSGANLSGANLNGANLNGANLNGANLSGAVLIEADLSGANLSTADLSTAMMFRAKLIEAYLSGANLSGANLIKTVLIEADLSGANLSRAKLFKADLSGAYLRGGEFSGADLIEADLSGTDLSTADLRGANLSKAKLFRADLSGANLSGANLSETDLSGTSLRGTNLKDCIFYDVEGFPLFYEPKAGRPPYIPSIAEFPDLKKLTFEKSPHGLVDLREGFKKLGYRKQEREITYALKYTQRRKLWNDKESSISDKLESLFYFLFFELTCQYGMKPGRPLLILMGLIPFFSFFYLFALGTKRQKAGIWLVFPKGRVPKTPEERPFKLSAKFPPRALPNGKLRKMKLRMLRWFRVIRIALYFSMLSAFSIGWRELNVGNWITRLQRREYFLRSTGWVRTVSGIQSLSSVYLLALWVLTYFGRPFEAI